MFGQVAKTSTLPRQMAVNVPLSQAFLNILSDCLCFHLRLYKTQDRPAYAGSAHYATQFATITNVTTKPRLFYTPLYFA